MGFGLPRRGFNSTLARGKGLNKVSPKRMIEDEMREALRTDWLKQHPNCQIGRILFAHAHPAATKCWGRATDVHETLKRSRKQGSFLDPTYFMSACPPCHQFTETEVELSTEWGLLVPSWEAAS